MNKKSLSLILLSLVFVSSLMFVSASVLDEAAPASIVFISQILNLGLVWKEIIIGLIMLLIIIVALYDILTLTSIFEGKAVKIIISVGLGLVFALTGLVNKFSIGMISFAAGFGAFAIWVEIIIALVMFIGISVGSTFLSMWAAKRYANRALVKSVKAAGETESGINFLRDIFNKSINK
jgi:hypothetical protein